MNESEQYRSNAPETVSIPLDVIIDILRRLPAKCIVRLRCVCKLWNSFTREQHFIRQHLQTTKKVGIEDLRVVTLYWDRLTQKSTISYFIDGYHQFEITQFNRDGRYKMSNSCNGLVCVYEWKTTYLVNPSIREVLVVPPPPTAGTREGIHSSIGLGQKMSTGEFLVVRVFEETRGCEIFKLGGSGSESDRWRRCNEDAPYIICPFHKPAYVKGVLYWLTINAPQFAISFDIERETFDVIPHLSGLGSRMQDYDSIDLVELGGQLCLTSFWACETTIWVLNSRNEWSRFYSFPLHELRDCSEIFRAKPLAIRDGKIVWRGASGRFDFFDPKTKSFLKPLYEPEKHPYSYAYPYKDSLISPLEMQRKNLVVVLKELASEEDPFSKIQFMLNSNIL